LSPEYPIGEEIAVQKNFEESKPASSKAGSEIKESQSTAKSAFFSPMSKYQRGQGQI
jgi:hypothetical protein